VENRAACDLNEAGSEVGPLTVTTIYHPRMISVPVSPYCELARWVLDRQGIPYVEECHTPLCSGMATRKYGGNVVPVLDTGETVLLDARAVVDYYEARAPQNLKLYPCDAAAEADARQLFNFLFDTFGVAARAWACACMLPERGVMISLCVKGVPWWERLGASIFYPWMAGKLRRSFGLQSNTISEQQPVIEAALSRIEERLADGRPFLMGDEITAPDLAFAALAAPILLPPQCGGPKPSFDRLPAAMRSAIEGWRKRPAGQFALRLYAENRPHRAPDLVALGKHGSGRTFKDRLLNFAIQPAILRPVFAVLRRVSPILLLGKHAIVTRNPDVIEVLTRNTAFTIRQINAPKIDQIDGPFILGMDASPQYDREKATLHEAVRRDDLEGIRQFVAQSANELISAARVHGRIDVVNGYARVVPVRLVASYFGMPGPDDPTMMRWMRDIFHYIFADLTNGKDVTHDALNSDRELHQHMDAQIAIRKSQLPGGGDDVLGRLLALRDAAHPWLDDHAVRRNLAGVIVGAVDTTSKFVTLAIDELLRRPAMLAGARECALKNDIEAVRHYAWEAVRFNPHHPLQVRYCEQATQVAQGQSRAKTIPAGSTVYIATLSAMFDDEVFTQPNEFDPQRQTDYLHFGYGMHTCFGIAINGIQIPELLAALLRLPNLRRAPGSAGRILYDGPFPNRLVLKFDA
jgi:cytochrome P450/glutathione S-transferase